MKHLVLIAGVYYPNPSPTGKCAMQYIELLKEDYEIDVIYIQSDLKRVYGEAIDGMTLYGLSNWRLLIETWFQNQYKKTDNKFLRRLFSTSVLVMKAIGRIQSVVLFPNNLRWFYKKAFRTLRNIHLFKPIDVVFTVNSPFSAHLAGEAFKKIYPNVRWVTYTVDPFYVGYRLSGNKKDSHKYHKAFSTEKQVLAQADTNFLSEEVFESSKDLFSDTKYKTYALPYLLPNNSKKVKDRFDKNKINLVYAGRFYKDVRNPEYLLRTFLNASNTDMVLHLYAASDCEAIINDYIRKSEGKIVRHELVDAKEIKNVLNSADILVTVGNSIPEFKPSKTFEYIATGLPILNFYQNNLKDELLERHPYALQISVDTELQYASSEIERFCLGNKGERMESTMIDLMYERHCMNTIRHILMTGME